MPNDYDPSSRGADHPIDDTHIYDLTERLEAISRDLSKTQRLFSADQIDRAITAAFKQQQKAFEQQIHRLIREALTSAFGGKGSVVQSLFNLIPGFARGGVLNRRVLLSRAGEAGPEVVLPLKKSADGRLGVVAQNPQGAAATPSSTSRRPEQIEVVLTPAPVAASLTTDDQDAIASAVMQAVDQAIDQRLAEQTHHGGVLGQTYFSAASQRWGF